MTNKKYNEFAKKNSSNTELIYFWSKIKIGYDKFDKEKKELKVSVSDTGDYKIH
jgi:hypothetical protein